MVVTRPGIERPGYRLIQGLLAEHPDWVRTRLCEERCRRGDLRNARGGSRMWPRAPGGQLAAARRDPTAHTQRPRAFDPDFGHGFVPLSNDQELPPGVVLRRTRGEALAIYHAGPEVVVRVLLEMDSRIHAPERQVQDLTARLDASDRRVPCLVPTGTPSVMILSDSIRLFSQYRST